MGRRVEVNLSRFSFLTHYARLSNVLTHDCVNIMCILCPAARPLSQVWHLADESCAGCIERRLSRSPKTNADERKLKRSLRLPTIRGAAASGEGRVISLCLRSSHHSLVSLIERCVQLLLWLIRSSCYKNVTSGIYFLSSLRISGSDWSILMRIRNLRTYYGYLYMRAKLQWSEIG